MAMWSYLQAVVLTSQMSWYPANSKRVPQVLETNTAGMIQCQMDVTPL